jgi:hypothetical protein
MIICACYHPPRPKYDSKELLKILVDDLGEITFRNPNAVAVIIGDFNSLNTDMLTYDCGLSLVNDPDAYTHGYRILDKRLVSQPDVYMCHTVQSAIKTKPKALHISVTTLAPPIHNPQAKVHCLCYDIMMPHLQMLCLSKFLTGILILVIPKRMLSSHVMLLDLFHLYSSFYCVSSIF